MYLINQDAADYFKVLHYCATVGYDVNNVDDLKDAFVEMYMDVAHLTDEDLTTLTQAFYETGASFDFPPDA